MSDLDAIFAQVASQPDLAASASNAPVVNSFLTPTNNSFDNDLGGDASGDFGFNNTPFGTSNFVSILPIMPTLQANFPALTGHWAALLSAFCQPMPTDERLGYIFGAQLQVLALRKEENTQKAVTYLLPKPLKDLVKVYVVAFLMSTQTSSWRGIDSAIRIAAAIRESYPGVGVPALGDAVRLPVLERYISLKLTSTRNIVKAKLEISVTEKQDVATLAHALVGGNASRPPPTIQVYRRAALLRYLFEAYGHEDDNKFWIKVDGKFATFRTKTNADAHAAMSVIYTNDVTKYGDPANNTKNLAVSTVDIPDWQVVLGRHAALVTPRPESDSTSAPPRKRARVSEQPEQENNGDDEMAGGAAGPAAAFMSG